VDLWEAVLFLVENLQDGAATGIEGLFVQRLSDDEVGQNCGQRGFAVFFSCQNLVPAGLLGH